MSHFSIKNKNRVSWMLCPVWRTLWITYSNLKDALASRNPLCFLPDLCSQEESCYMWPQQSTQIFIGLSSLVILLTSTSKTLTHPFIVTLDRPSLCDCLNENGIHWNTHTHTHKFFSCFQTQTLLFSFDFQHASLGVKSYIVWSKFLWMGHFPALLLYCEHTHDNN